MQTMRLQRSSTPGLLDGAHAAVLVALKALAVVAATALVVGVIVFARDEQTTAVDAEVGTTWLSAEAGGRIALVAPRAARPSLSTQLVEEAAAYDLVDLGGRLVVHDRVEGGIIVFDAATGVELDRFDGQVTTDPRPALVGGGDRAYLVDTSRNELRVLIGDTISEPLPLDFQPADWAVGSDGLLWLIDRENRRLVRFDGNEFTSDTAGLNGDEFSLVVLGDQPAIYEPATGRLRWLRAGTSFDVPGAAGGGVVALLAESGASSGCVVVVTPTRLSCHTREGIVFDVALAGAVPADGVVGGDDDLAVVAVTGSTALTVVDVATGTVTTVERRAPSGRLPLVRIVAGAVVVDDPGSRYAYTVASSTSTPVETDKLSRRTVVITSDGAPTEGGLGNVDADAEVSAAIEGETTETPADDDGRNDPPIPRPDRVTTRTGRDVTVAVLANDVDPDGDALAVIAVDPLSPSDGTASVLGGTSVRYEPPTESSNRTITFGYQVADPGGLVAGTTVTVELIGDGSNREPSAVDDAIETRAGSAVTVPVLANDRDSDGDPLTVVLAEGASHGTLAVDGGVQVRYEPEAGFVGEDSFDYEVTDGYGGSARASVRVTVTDGSADNRPPIAVDDRVFVQAGIPFQLDPLANDRDPDGDRITLQRVSPLANVQVDIEESTLRLVAESNVSGLVVFSYTIADEAGAEATARVVAFVEQPAAGEPPVAIDDRASTTAETTIDLVANDISPDGSQLVVDSFTQPTSGTVVSLSPTVVRFTPAAGFVGTTVFTYTVTNATGLTDTATVTVEVVPSSNSGPVAVDDSVTIYRGQWAEVRALANDRHPEGLPIAYSGLPSVSAGSARILGNGAIRFQPPNQDLTTYVVGYRIRDSLGRTASATITVRVVELPAVNLLPITSNDVASVVPGGAVDIAVLANDRDPDGGTLTLVSVAGPSRGRVDRIGDVVRYTAPNDDGGGVVEFGYTVVDDEGATASGSVSVQIAVRPKLPPVPAPDLVSLTVGTATTVGVLANDVDPDGPSDGLSIASLGAVTPSGGASASMSGKAVRVAAGATAGTFQMPYTVVDLDGQRASSTLTIVVTDIPNRPPVAVDDTLATVALPFSVNVLLNDSDPDGGQLRLVGIDSVSPATAGRARIDGSRVAFDPERSFSGTIVIVYTVADAEGRTDQGTLTVTMSACPALPAIGDQTASTSPNTPVDVRVLGAPVAGVTLSVNPPSSGSVSVVGGTTLRFVPVAGGSSTVGFSVANSCDERRSATLTVLANTSPTAVNDTAVTRRNTDVVIDVLANDGDPDAGDTIRVVTVVAGTGGTPSLSGGTVTFRPTSNFVGTARFTYTIQDVSGATGTASVSVEVGNAAPRARNDEAVVPETASVVIGTVLDNDTDADGDTLTITALGPLPSSALGSTATTDGRVVRVDLDPALGPGAFTFSYTVSDGLATATANFTVRLTDVNDAPIVVNETVTMNLADQQSIVVQVLLNDYDPDGEHSGLRIVAVTGPGEIVNNGRRIRYTHVGDQGAEVQIGYTVSDGTATATGILTLLVVAAPPPPTTAPPPTTEPPPTTAAPPNAPAPEGN
jgi:hypothetical protein